MKTNIEWIGLMRKHLPFVAIVALVYWIMHQDAQLSELHRQMDQQKLDMLKYWRDAYTKQAENYFILIQKQQEDAQRKLDKSRYN